MKIRLSLVLLIFCIFKFYSVEAILIDFNNLEDTTIDFSDFAGTNFTQDEKEQMKINLDIKNWNVKVNSSSLNTISKNKTKIVDIKDSLEYPNQSVLGVRIFFPQRRANSYAEIIPPFEIPSYYDTPKNPDGLGSMFVYKGVIRNVEVIKKIAVRVLGNNFRYGLYIRVKDKSNENKDIFVGYLNYIGWQTLTWINPNYERILEEGQKRKAKGDDRPFYPDEFPYIKFEGFVIQRDSTEIAGNFTTMIKEVSVEYVERFIDIGTAEPSQRQENVFNVYKEELIIKSQKEMKDVNRRIFQQWVENNKMHR
ncbi:MAG: hypothetical protein A2086_04090 [Spirochaetes bacterium GWD1_27_9]|nr:MAG: hypothetical protein A2Z98_07685 [Spirochaetes bacterium GWB1_27_13]OHD43405.1 MAG: hypothetical protein A2086_04090 [Spirochaetes bacterium GWD1_27_9]